MRNDGHGLVTGQSRVSEYRPVTTVQSVQDGFVHAQLVLLSPQVTGLENVGVTHVRTEGPLTGEHTPPATRDRVTSAENTVQDKENAVTPTRDQTPHPVTGPHLITIIHHAHEILRSNPNTYPTLHHNPNLTTHARALTDASHAGEDTTTLHALATQLQTTLHHIRNGTRPPTNDKFTRPRPKTTRQTAKPRTEAPPMKATASAPKKTTKPRTNKTTPHTLLNTLHHEAAATTDALTAHAITCLTPALHWINGDPLTITFPSAYQQERLAKLCAYLQTIHGTTKLEPARASMLTALHELWPAYQDACSHAPLNSALEGDDNTQEYRAWNFPERTPSPWGGPFDPPLDAPAPDLPEFRDTECGRISSSWHLTLLAVVFLNHWTGRRLLDFDVEASAREVA